MSSGVFPLDGPFVGHCPDFLFSDLDSLSLFPFSNSQLESGSTLQSSSSSSSLLSSSPPSQPMLGLSLSPSTACHVSSSLNVLNLDVGVKFEGFESAQLDFDRASLTQRSFSSQSLDHKPSSLFHPHFSTVSEQPTSIRTLVVIHSNENGATVGGPMRRVCSTGDLQKLIRVQHSQGSPSPQANQIPVPEEAGLRVVRYSSEERKERIHRYRNKRNQRNFNKTIKYVCRKTLADSRPRVRGRFARNEEAGEIPKANGSNKEEEDELQLWVDRFVEEEMDVHQLW